MRTSLRLVNYGQMWKGTSNDNFKICILLAHTSIGKLAEYMDCKINIPEC